MRILMRKSWIAALALCAVALPPAAWAAAADQEGSEAQQARSKVVDVTIKSADQEDPAAEVPIGPQQRNFRARLLLLRQIAADPEVAGVRLKVKGAPDFARTIDLLKDLRALKDAGKKIVCYAETMDQRSLMFASLADVLAMPPSGMVVLEGLLAEVMYLKDLLALIDLKVEVQHVGEFKTAYEELARSTMSDEQRKVIGLLLEEFYGQILETIAAQRGIGRDKVEALFDEMIVTPRRAQEAGLISMVGYRDEFDQRCEEVFGGKVEYDEDYGDSGKEDLEKMLENPFGMFQVMIKLLKPEKKELPAEPRIAVVYATGPIQSGKSKSGFDGTVSAMGSETIVKALDTVLADDWVKAVILRVNSPGGSAIASDMIWRATQRVKAKKPIIASMGGVAGSGGYWISMGCDRIVAQPSTLTGSIGVVSMLPDPSGTMKKMHINVEAVGIGPHWEELAVLKSGVGPAIKKKIHDNMVQVYEEFVDKVSKGRGMNPQVLETLARGRVWTGRQALDLNLVDRLGGIEESIALACELAGGGLDPKTVALVEYPAAPNFFEQIEEAFEEMTTTEGQARRLLAKLGYGDFAAAAETLLESCGGGLGPDCVQAIMPFALRIR
ncbi:MAG: signal peptide peptidase SppA [Planctomycetes bacterium]|nr:signal peptide peptidase SppA [Planctomycetota bacterium]